MNNLPHYGAVSNGGGGRGGGGCSERMMMVMESGNAGDGDGGSGAESGRSSVRWREGAEVAGRLLGVRPARPFVLYC